MSENPYQAPTQAALPAGPGKDKLLRVAKAQRLVIAALLAGIGMTICLNSLTSIFGFQVVGILVAILVAGFMAYAMYSLAKELNSRGVAVVYAIAMIIPCVSLIGLLIVNQQATGYLKKHGIVVGFIGANLAQFDS